MVYRIALCNAKKKEDAEDIFQEVFIALIKNIKKIKTDMHLKYWLIRTTINYSKNLHLSFWRRGVILKNEDDAKGGRGDIDVFDKGLDDGFDYEFDDEINMLRNEIDKLSNKQKSVIYLYYYEGYLVKEIAEILKISEGTVKSRLNSARKNLKINLERIKNG